MKFRREDLERLHQPRRWLNDECINGCAQVLLQHFGTGGVTGGSPVVISSFTVTQHRNQSYDRAVWSCVQATRFWEKDVWIIPIHQAERNHWELAVIYIKRLRIAYFDSFGHSETTSWRADVQVNDFSLNLPG